MISTEDNPPRGRDHGECCHTKNLVILIVTELSLSLLISLQKTSLCPIVVMVSAVIQRIVVVLIVTLLSLFFYTILTHDS